MSILYKYSWSRKLASKNGKSETDKPQEISAADRSAVAAALGRLGRGKPKNYSKQERERRRRWAAQIRQIRLTKIRAAKLAAKAVAL